MTVHNCTSPSNDLYASSGMQQWHAAVACSNDNQAHLHTHVSVPYLSPDVCLGLELLRDIQFGLSAILRAGSERGNPKILGALREPVAEPPFLNF